MSQFACAPPHNSVVPLVSIIVPTYNQADYLPQCLDSLWFQDWPDLEIIVVNDGSTDGTSVALDAYAHALETDTASYAAMYDERNDMVQRVVHRRYPQEGRRFKVVSHCSNKGLSHALNTGLAEARGGLCTFVSSDDIAMPNMISVLAGAIRERGADFAYGDMFIVDDNMRILRRFSLPDYSFEASFRRWYLCGVAKLYKRELHDAAGIFNPTCHVQDHEMFLRFAEGGARFAHVPHVLMNVRAHIGDRRVGNHSPANETRQHRESAALAIRARGRVSSPRSVAIIPARGGSKGIPGKNIADLGGKPLIAWSIESAWKIPGISRVIVSTDSREIREAALRHGAEVPFMRPAELATDTASMHDANMHALAWLKERGFVPDWWFVLEPTHPFRSEAMMRAAVEKLREGYKDFITVSMVSPETLYERRFAIERKDGGLALLPVPPRAAWYCPDGQLYAGNIGQKGGDYSLGGRWLEIVNGTADLVDIDQPADLDFARALLAGGLPAEDVANGLPEGGLPAESATALNGLRGHGRGGIIRGEALPDIAPAAPHPCRYRMAFARADEGRMEPVAPGNCGVRMERGWENPALPFARDEGGRLVNLLTGARILGRQDYPPVYSVSREYAARIGAELLGGAAGGGADENAFPERKGASS